MNYNPHSNGVDHAFTGTLKLNMNTVPISSTKGSKDWLLAQGAAEVKFHEISAPEGLIRVADLNIADETLRIAADGYFYMEERCEWVARNGIHPLPISWEDLYSGRLTFGVAFTPAAKAIVEKVAEDVRTAFKAWVESDCAS